MRKFSVFYIIHSSGFVESASPSGVTQFKEVAIAAGTTVSFNFFTFRTPHNTDAEVPTVLYARIVIEVIVFGRNGAPGNKRLDCGGIEASSILFGSIEVLNYVARIMRHSHRAQEQQIAVYELRLIGIRQGKLERKLRVVCGICFVGV